MPSGRRSTTSSAPAAADRGEHRLALVDAVEVADADAAAGEVLEAEEVLEGARQPLAPRGRRDARRGRAPSTVTRPDGRVVEAAQQLHERRLAGAVLADEGDDGAGRQREVDVVEHERGRCRGRRTRRPRTGWRRRADRAPALGGQAVVGGGEVLEPHEALRRVEGPAQELGLADGDADVPRQVRSGGEHEHHVAGRRVEAGWRPTRRRRRSARPKTSHPPAYQAALVHRAAATASYQRCHAARRRSAHRVGHAEHPQLLRRPRGGGAARRGAGRDGGARRPPPRLARSTAPGATRARPSAPRTRASTIRRGSTDTSRSTVIDEAAGRADRAHQRRVQVVEQEHVLPEQLEPIEVAAGRSWCSSVGHDRLQAGDVRLELDRRPVAEAHLDARSERAQQPPAGGGRRQARRRPADRAVVAAGDRVDEHLQPQRGERVRQPRQRHERRTTRRAVAARPRYASRIERPSDRITDGRSASAVLRPEGAHCERLQLGGLVVLEGVAEARRLELEHACGSDRRRSR